MKVSVVVPVYNEEENVPHLAKEFAQLAGKLGRRVAMTARG